jgi:hypothetical protein
MERLLLQNYLKSVKMQESELLPEKANEREHELTLSELEEFLDFLDQEGNDRSLLLMKIRSLVYPYLSDRNIGRIIVCGINEENINTYFVDALVMTRPINNPRSHWPIMPNIPKEYIDDHLGFDSDILIQPRPQLYDPIVKSMAKSNKKDHSEDEKWYNRNYKSKKRKYK